MLKKFGIFKLDLSFFFVFRDASHTTFASNNRYSSAWDLESGYGKEYNEHEYPVRVFESGEKGALEIILTSYEQDFDFICNAYRQGFMVYISALEDELELSQYFHTEFFEDVSIMVKPKVMTTSNELRNYKPKQRECFYHYERQLRFFKQYTKQNCISECEANITKMICGCVKFSMPRMLIKFLSIKKINFSHRWFLQFLIPGDKNTKICGEAKIRCYKEIYQDAALLISQCNCLPSCSSVGYEKKLDRTKLSMKIDGVVDKSSTNDHGYEICNIFHMIFFLLFHTILKPWSATIPKP